MAQTTTALSCRRDLHGDCRGRRRQRHTASTPTRAGLESPARFTRRSVSECIARGPDPNRIPADIRRRSSTSSGVFPSRLVRKHLRCQSERRMENNRLGGFSGHRTTEITTSAIILDAFGQAQNIGLGTIPVTVNSTEIPLAFSASPNSGSTARNDVQCEHFGPGWPASLVLGSVR